MDLDATKLPQEMCDLIIDFLSECAPKQAVANATLVCHSWLQRTSQHLLRELEVDVLQLDRFVSVAKASQRLGTHVEQLTINGAFDFPRRADDILDALPSLSLLELWSNCLEPREFHDTENVRRRHSVRHLKLSCVDCHGMTYLLRPFESIGTLEVRSVEESQESVRLDDSASVRVERLILNDCSSKAVMDTLRTLVSPTAVFFNGFNVKQVPAMARFLEKAGETVEHINFLPAYEYGEDAASTSTPLCELVRFVINAHHTVIMALTGEDRYRHLAVLGKCPHLRSITINMADVEVGIPPNVWLVLKVLL